MLPPRSLLTVIRLIFSFFLLVLISSCFKQPKPQNRYNPIKISKAILRIDSVPQGAEVFLNGARIGKTPINHSLEYKYRRGVDHPDVLKQNSIKVVKKGYKPYETLFRIKNREYTNIPHPIELYKRIDQLVSITGAAEGLIRLTTGGAHERVSSLSNDNKWLLIDSREDFDSDSKTIIEKLETQKLFKILLTNKNSSSRNGEWLPNNKKFVFSSNRLGSYTLVESLGSSGEVGVKFLSEQSIGNISDPSYSTKGEIAFTVTKNSSSSIAIVDQNGNNLRLYENGKQPDFSNDGRKIAFIRKLGGGYDKLFIFEPHSGGNMIQLTDDASNDGYPSWSNDGQKIAFISDRVRGNRHIFIYNLISRRVTQITEGNFEVNSVLWGENNTLYFSANAGENWDVWKTIYR